MSEVARPTDEQLTALLRQEGAPREGSLWKHATTGKVYMVRFLSLDEETLDVLVTYQRRDLPRLRWTRTLAAWSRPGRFVPWEPEE